MYQELAGGLLLQGQEQDRERYRNQLHRLSELESGNATGPGWRSPASVVKRAPERSRDCPRPPVLLQWVRAMRPAAAEV